MPVEDLNKLRPVYSIVGKKGQVFHSLKVNPPFLVTTLCCIFFPFFLKIFLGNNLSNKNVTELWKLSFNGNPLLASPYFVRKCEPLLLLF